LKAKIYVRLKEGILDPEGVTVGKALKALGFAGVGDVHVGKYIELTLKETDPERARESVDEMCRRLLTNPVIERYYCEVF